MTPIDSVSSFVHQLATTEVPENVVNIYAAGDDVSDGANHARRRHNLTRYLEQMLARKPALMLVLEAPSYRGMRITGVPVAGRMFTDGLSELGLFGLKNGYLDVLEPGFTAPPNGNQTGVILWQTLSDLKLPALVWNAFPFHPYLPGNPHSNRMPRPAEIRLAVPQLETIMRLFACPQVIAVGNIADQALTLMNVPHVKIRHPAQGGKNLFVSGLKAAVGKN